MIRAFRVALLVPTLAVITLASASRAQAETSWHTTPKAAFDAAQASGKPILVFASATWCGPCQKMKKDTWADATVEAVVAGNFEMLKLDGDKHRKLLKKMKVSAFPTTLLYSPGGHYADMHEGYAAPLKLLTWLKQQQP